MTTRAPYPHEPPNESAGNAGPSGPGGRRTGRSRPSKRSLLPLALAAWVVLEVWLLILVAEAAGGLTVLALLVGGFLAGSTVMKRAGRRAWSRLAENVQRAQAQGAPAGVPTDQTGERPAGGNALAMLGGLLLIIPGLITDVAGLFCVFPPTAGLLRKLAHRYAARRGAFEPGTLGDAYRQAREREEQLRTQQQHGDGKVVEGEVIRDDEPPR